MEGTTKTRIIIADDHDIYRIGLIQLVNAAGSYEVIREYENGHDLLEGIRSCSCDIVITDFAMPQLNGIEVLQQIRAEKLTIPFIILSSYPEEVYALRAFKAGASAYLNKSMASKEIVQAIRAIEEGGTYISPSFAHVLVNIMNSSTKGKNERHDILSNRELEVMKCLARGMSNVEIAAAMNISNKTVSTYKRRVFDKMEFESTVDLLHYVFDNKLL